MKVLILVLSSEQHPEEGQEKTWDAIEQPGVGTIYYFSNPIGLATQLYGNRLHVPAPDDFYMMHRRLKHALGHVLQMEWDHIFRISASSYVDKELLLEKAATLPKEKVYCGVPCCGGSVASGCGFFISRDVAQLLYEQIPHDLDNCVYGNHPDDVLVGKILEANGIYVQPGERYDYYHTNEPFKRHYHYRCKCDNTTNDGIRDVEAMKQIYDRTIHGTY